MSNESNAQRVLAFIDRVWNRGELAATDELVAPDYAPDGISARGPAAARVLVERFAAAFAELAIDVQDVIAADDRVVVRYGFRGVHRGPWMGVEPTGVAVDVPGITIYRVVEGRIAQMWFSYDALGLLRQLETKGASVRANADRDA